MKKVLIRYPAGGTTKVRKFKVALTTKGTVLRTYIGHHLSQFRDADYALVLKSLDGNLSFLSETKPLTKISASRKIELQLVPRTRETKILRADGSVENFTIRTDKSVMENISTLIQGDSSGYVFAFKAKAEHTFHRLTATSMPMIFQNWSQEPVSLLRRISLDDIQFENNERKIMDLFINAKAATAMGLSVYSFEDWGTLSVLQYIADGGKLFMADRNSLLNGVPQLFRNEEAVLSAVTEASARYSKCTRKDAAKTYVKMGVDLGTQCCFVDKVRFLMLSKKQRVASHRTLYVSSSMICVTKEFQTTSLGAHAEAIENIEDLSFDGDFIVIVFRNENKWRIKCDKPRVLISVINEMRKAGALYDDSMGAEPSESTSEAGVSDSEFFTAVFDTRNLDANHVPDQDLPPGISLLVCPTPEEGNEPYDITDQLYRDLKIVKPLVIPAETHPKFEDVPELKPLTDLERLFSLKQKPAKVMTLAIAVMYLCILLSNKLLNIYI